MSAQVGMGITEAVEFTGVPERTLRRRVDAWLAGVRDKPYAIKGRREYGTEGQRLIDRVDAERVRLQRAGRLDAAITAVEYARARGQASESPSS